MTPMLPEHPPASTANPEWKQAVRDFWNRASCGEVYASGATLADQLAAHAEARYQLEPYIRDFARFHEAAGHDVLEVGVGMGADHLEFAKARPRHLVGIDLTPRAVEFTRQRLDLYGLSSDLRVGDAEALSFADESFDFVYSYGVLHHSPDTQRAVQEVWRVLRPGGRARIMIYSKWSLVGLMLWTHYGLLAGRPLAALSEIYATYLESPGTKAYSRKQARKMFERFSHVDLWTQLSLGDLLEGEAGQRHQGGILRLAKAIWPRPLIRLTCRRLGLFLMLEAVK